MEISRRLFQCILLQLFCYIIWDIFFGRRCIVVDLEHPATVSIAGQSSDGAEIWGFVEVRKGAHLFWSYYKSPHRVSSPGKPWPTIFYAAPAASSGHGNFNGIGALEARSSTWLHNADLLVVDTPVGTGKSYEEDATRAGTGNSYEDDESSGIINRVWSSPQKRTVKVQGSADILVLLKALTREIASLQSSPLILLHSTYGGTYAGEISSIIVQAILTGGALSDLTVGGLLKGFDGTLEQHQRSSWNRSTIYGSNVGRLSAGQGTFANSWLPYTGLYMLGNSLFGWNCLAPWFSHPTRTAIRRRYNLERSFEAFTRQCGCCGSLLEDEERREHLETVYNLANHYICHPCALCQEGLELHRRVPHPGFNNGHSIFVMMPTQSTMRRGM